MKSTSQRDVDVAHQVGQEEERALEHADQQQVLARVVGGDDLRAELRIAVLELVGLDEDLADRVVAEHRRAAVYGGRHARRTRSRVAAVTGSARRWRRPGPRRSRRRRARRARRGARVARDLAVGEQVLQRAAAAEAERAHPVPGPPRPDLERRRERARRRACRRRSARSRAGARGQLAAAEGAPGRGPASARRARAPARRAARSNRSRPYSTTARRPPPRSSAALPPAAPSARISVVGAARRRTAGAEPGARPAPGRRGAGREPGERRRQRGEPGELGARSASAASTAASSTAASSRSSAERAQDVGLRRRVQLAQRRAWPARIAVARVGGRVVARVLAPGQPALGAVGRGLLAGREQQRADEPARARRHPEQRAAAGRGGEPVEHGLDLVGRGVAGGDDGAAARARSGPRGVALVARPGLHVAALGRAAGARPRARRRAARTARRSAPRRRRPRRAGRS